MKPTEEKVRVIPDASVSEGCNACGQGNGALEDQLKTGLLCIIATVGLLLAPVSASATTADARQAALDRIVRAGATSAVAEVRDGDEIWSGASGVTQVDKREPAHPQGHFRAGSVTKTFVATVIMQLIAEDRFALDTPVEQVLPDVVPNGDAITIRQLLGHTSGLFDCVDTLPLDPPSGFLDMRWRTWTAQELLDRAFAHRPVSAPGAEYHYSSTDYIVLGMVVEHVTGRSYAEAIEQRIIRPLRLAGTSLPGTDPRIRGVHAHGYLPTESGLVDITEMNPSVMGAAGQLITTAADLNRFMAALLGGELLPQRQLDDMTAEGLGLKQLDLPCGTAIGHDGDALGYSAWSFATADRQLTLSVAWGEREPVGALHDALAEMLCAA